MEKRNKITDLDGLEVLNVSNQKSSFPKHFHETFCVSLIHDGIEAIQMEDNLLYTEKGYISINNPYEIHANPIVEKTITNSFTTLYLSPDLVNSILNQKDVAFSHQQMTNKGLVETFMRISKNIKQRFLPEIEQDLSHLLNTFKIGSNGILDQKKYSNSKWRDVLLFIDHHLESKISLEVLAKFMNMEKFTFAKEFREKYGLSPINYFMMKKIFRIKGSITKTTNLTQLAYQFDFSDQAHFSKQFKRYIGLSPSAYKKQL